MSRRLFSLHASIREGQGEFDLRPLPLCTLHIATAAHADQALAAEMKGRYVPAEVKADMERRLKETIGVRVTVTVHAKGELDPYTQTSKSSKVKRLMDRRHTTSW